MGARHATTVTVPMATIPVPSSWEVDGRSPRNTPASNRFHTRVRAAKDALSVCDKRDSVRMFRSAPITMQAMPAMNFQWR